MSRAGAAAAALFLLSLLLPAAGAAAASPLATTLQVAGDAHADGVARLLESRAAAHPGTEIRLSAPSWTVTAIAGSGMTATGLTTVRTKEPTPTQSTWHGEIVARPWDHDAQAYAAALPGSAPHLAGSFQSARISAPTVGCEDRPTHFLSGQQTGPCVPLQDAHLVGTMDGSLRLRWTGPIQIQLWSWNVTGSGGQAWSGSLHQPLHPNAPLTEERNQILVLTAVAAEATFVIPGDGARLALSESAWNVDGTVVVEDALAGAVTRTTGTQSFRLAPRHGEAIPVEPLAVAAEPVAAAGPGWAGASAAAAILVLAALAAVAAWRRSHPAELLVAPDDPHEAAAAARATGHPQADQQAAILRTIAFIRSRQPDEAEAILQAQHGADPLDKADHAFLLACIRALQGRANEAAAAVRACLAAAPSYVAEVRGTPILRGLLEATEEGYA